MLLVQKVKVKWNAKIKKHYVEKGYAYTKMGDEFEVNAHDLTKGSNVIVDISCDYCGEVFKRQYYTYINVQEKQVVPKDCCINCSEKKIIEVNNAKYGVDYPRQNSEVNAKYKEIIIEKFGVSNVFQLEEVKQKIIQTNIKKYGVPYYTQTEEYDRRVRETCNEKYGCDYVLQSKSIIEKIRNTHLEKYGVTSLMKLEDVKRDRMIKKAKTLFENGTAPISKQQKYICDVLNGIPNFPVEHLNLDITISENIYIEYHGSGHWLTVDMGDKTQEQFDRDERNRQYFLKSKGWKLIRLISRNDRLPSDEKLIEIIEKAKEILLNGRSWIEINIDDSSFSYKDTKFDYAFGVLRKIKKEQVS